MTKLHKFIIAVGLQAAIILFIVIYKVLILTGGTSVMLGIEPVDPRDILRGDYVTFQYEISSVSYYYLRDKSVRNGDTVYVVLEKYSYNDNWNATSVTTKKPEVGEIFIMGKVVSGAETNTLDPAGRNTSSRDDLRIAYGIEQYFIPEGSGSDFNHLANTDKVSALVKLDENGNAALDKLFVNDKPWP